MSNKVRLGDLLVRVGLISDSDLRVVLALQKQHGGRLGEHLVRVNLVTEEQIARALAQQLALPYNDLVQPPSPSVTSLLPEKVASRLQALPVAFDARTQHLSVAFADPLDDDAVAEVARATGKQIAVQVTPANQLRRAIEHAYFGLEVSDEGTSEFQLVDIHGRGKTIKVGVQPAEADGDDELPVLETGDFEAIGTSELVAVSLEDRYGSEHAPLGRAPPVAASEGAGEEALRTVWALADLLIERGYFSRAEMMKSLRSK